MENIPDADRAVALSTFVRVPVNHNNRKMTMAKCKSCNIIMPINDFPLWKHWYGF